MKKSLYFPALAALLVLLLSACSQAPAPTTVPVEDLVATQVAVLLTTTPAPVVIPPDVATATLAVQPTSTPTESLPTPTSEPSPTPTLPPTETQPAALPTSTPPATDPRLTLGTPAFLDNTFASGRNWDTDWEDTFTKGRLENNQMIMTSVGVDGWKVSWPQPEDFYIEMTARTGACSGADRYGLIVRVPESYDRGYLVGVTCDGRVSLRKWTPGATDYTYLVPWTGSPHVNAGSDQTNRIGLKAVGSSFEVYVNGHLVGTGTDTQFKEGRFGPFIGHDKTANFTIYITEIAYWEIE